MPSRKSKNLVGATGEYYVCAELGKQGILGLLPPKNNPLFDIIAVSEDAKKTVAIQVKTMSLGNKQGWRLGKNLCTRQNNPNLFVVLVNLKEKDVDYYIYEYDILSEIIEKLYAKYLKKTKKDGTPRKDVDFRWYDFRFFTPEDHKRKNEWSILGFK